MSEWSTARMPLARRTAMKALASGIVALVVPFAGLRSASATPMFDYGIAGGRYHGLCEVRDRIVVGERLRLRAEPGNPYDANAVAVERMDGLMLGYVSRRAVPPVARLLAAGARIDATVVGQIVCPLRDDIAVTDAGIGDPRIRPTRRG
ncbi:MAG: hypothetical protein FJX53_02505 [Alphaproteobacteria bacterium]|nr:hypothetical protein [Alphaproteobacteria bacterium]